ncbi:stearoyl-CoA desaturase (delta-9 desaturase) [Actinokineospora alba]|uniref:Stearoyl-CoA desaturase (Delta-9 desaturase) n=1 Tax=Actinokineospora alba TaxID=504798 RepID=A0A1H0W302_9PSEU|nr:acyl-CoA desaturase [Actinokineospora alba]TDP67822.1 stearoyl-CoA desaturase (delta-9 desaturase) [Actinokineospora alba]SDI72451.1 stearoyl-CoA desaturase (delta-9 desaturase) [Actinokineospora alba]SDP85107.1 stearoyl-CoA desaturase (delta-9 desaturase) [Actinokineospora alba]
MTATVEGSTQVDQDGPKPMFGEPRGLWPQIGTYLFILIPFVALIAAVPFAWGWGLGWVDVGLAAFFYTFTCLGTTVGFHRYFTHGAFKAKRAVRVGLAISGSMSLQGPILHWVADHRRHHAFADRDGDPHSPWAFGTSPAALVKGFWHAHMGWIFDRKLTNAERFAPDMLADPDIRRIDKQFGMWTAVTMLAPPVLGGLLTWSWWGAVTAFFWASLVRVSFLHHVTWSTNSICHIVGNRPFKSRDKATNFWPLAILSMGEAWHNLHHADPTSARHGVQRGQIDISARLIWLFEKFGWVSEVRWPTPQRLAKLTK